MNKPNLLISTGMDQLSVHHVWTKQENMIRWLFPSPNELVCHCAGGARKLWLRPDGLVMHEYQLRSVHANIYSMKPRD